MGCGLSGGNVIEEFFGKFKYDEKHLLVGSYSNSVGSISWDYYLQSLKFSIKSSKFEDKFDLLDPKLMLTDLDLDSQEKMIKYLMSIVDLEKFLSGDKLKKSSITNKKIKVNKGQNYFSSKNWNLEFMEMTMSDIWNISLKFPQTLDPYQ